jgi:hypothetical protein
MAVWDFVGLNHQAGSQSQEVGGAAEREFLDLNGVRESRKWLVVEAKQALGEVASAFRAEQRNRLLALWQLAPFPGDVESNEVDSVIGVKVGEGDVCYAFPRMIVLRQAMADTRAAIDEQTDRRGIYKHAGLNAVGVWRRTRRTQYGYTH